MSKGTSPIIATITRLISFSRGGFYGWWIILGSTAILFVSSGIGFYGHGVILDPLRAQYGWSKGVISLAVTMYFATAGAMGMVIGRFIDRYGPKPVLILGSTIMGIGFFLLSRVTQLWQFFAVYLLMAIGWSGTSLVPISTLITNWFIRRRGFAMGLTMTGLSLGGVVLVPFAVYLISHWGLRSALPVLGLTFWIVVIPVALLVIKQRPSDVGQFPDGGQPPVSGSEKTPGIRTSLASQWKVWTRGRAMRTPAFWSIVAAFLLALSGQIAFLVHQISFLSQTLGPARAAFSGERHRQRQHFRPPFPGTDRRPLRQAVCNHVLLFYPGSSHPLFSLFPPGGGPLSGDLCLRFDHGRGRHDAAASYRRVLRHDLLWDDFRVVRAVHHVRRIFGSGDRRLDFRRHPGLSDSLYLFCRGQSAGHGDGLFRPAPPGLIWSKVLLDNTLADLYGVETKQLKRAIRRIGV